MRHDEPANAIIKNEIDSPSAIMSRCAVELPRP